MTAVRGATTIEKDTPENIRAAVRELLFAVCEKNGLSEGDIAFILLSSTQDIHSFYPAKAAREAGFSSVALFSSAEPDITGALPLCIRTLVVSDKTFAPVYVYLHAAKTLRKDLGRFSVALDGPGGSGKSTVARRLAKELDILYLDTGAMYRAVALACTDAFGPDFTEENVREVLKDIDLSIGYIGGEQHTFLSGADVSERIRSSLISMKASFVSAFPFVREKMVEMQRKIAAEMSCVLDGRDIGTVVLPDADFKFFVTASPDVRAMRRFEELKAKGSEESFEKVKREIEERDRMDTTRAASPLRQAEDAVYVDTSDLSAEEVTQLILRKIQERV